MQRQPRPTPSPLLIAVAALFVATLVTSNIIAVKVASVMSYALSLGLTRM